MNRSQLRRRAGYTLVEMMIVVLVMGVMASAAVPRFMKETHRRRVQTASNRVYHELRHAARIAVVRSTSVSVFFYPAGDLIFVFGVDDPDQPGGTYTVDLMKSHGADMTAAAFGSVTPMNFVTFNGYGIPNGPGQVIVTSGGVSSTVSLSAAGEVTRQ